MPTYLYRCRECDHREQHTAQLAAGNQCPACDADLIRDYKAEGANVNLANCRAAR